MQKSGSTKYVKAVLNLLTAVVLLLLVIFCAAQAAGIFHALCGGLDHRHDSESSGPFF